MKRRGQDRWGKMRSKKQTGERADSIARINARLLDQYKGQTIRLTAKIIKLNGETATVEASDGGQVSVFFFHSLFSHSPLFPLRLVLQVYATLSPLTKSYHSQDRS